MTVTEVLVLLLHMVTRYNILSSGQQVMDQWEVLPSLLLKHQGWNPTEGMNSMTKVATVILPIPLQQIIPVPVAQVVHKKVERKPVFGLNNFSGKYGEL